MKKIHEQRFEAAKALFQRLIDIPDDYQIFYDGAVLEKSSIKITNNSILVWLDDNYVETWFEFDENYDHGIYTPIAEYEANVRKSFKVIKIMEKW